MDSSPLVKAHDHARAASTASKQSSSDTTVAISEHTHAAGEFAKAAESTSSLEALRTLKLLEDHHQKLAQLLRLPPEQPEGQDHASQENGEKAEAEGDAEFVTEKAKNAKDGARDRASPRVAQKPNLPGQRRIATREMSSSIASNLASARGIRSKSRGLPLSPSVSNDQGRGDVDVYTRRDASKAKMQNLIEQQPGKPAWVPPMPAQGVKLDSRTPRRAVTAPIESTAVKAEDGGYTKFYNTFGSLINKISAPLAFAGLPLIQEEAALAEEQPSQSQAALSPDPSQKRTQGRPQNATVTAHDEDVAKFYSKAAMRAIEGHNASESFYVVPTSGGTMSYANILSYDKKERRRLGGASVHSSLDEEDFVDARETPVTLSPGAKRRTGGATTQRELNNTIEELYTENKSLKDMIDILTKRLHVFEASSQNSHLALAESYRLMRPGSPQPGAGGEGRKGAEAELLAVTQQLEKLEKDNRKMQKTLDKYREKWEALKAGAKARREGKSGVDSVEYAAA